MQEYEKFVEKFKPKLTTDDCYTPAWTYNTVQEWASKRYQLEGREIVRPFWPGLDYTRAEYPSGCVVLDNPPFSILAQIIDFYIEHDIDFFLFAHGLTLFNSGWRDKVTLILGDSIIFENGARVNIGFVTNMDKKAKIVVDCDLCKSLKKKSVQKRVEYPDNVMTVGRLKSFGRKGGSIEIPKESCKFVRTMGGQPIYGCGFVVSDQIAKQVEWSKREDAETIPVELTDKDREIIKEVRQYG